MPFITAIYTDDTNPRRFVSATSRRDGVIDNNLIAELTTNKHQAQDFGTDENAKLVIARIHNPFDRTYQCDRVEVLQRAASQSTIDDVL